jgi:thiol:disulfide interchange protein DsbD
MAVLAGVVTALRLAGTSVGWGFQFQQPLFVASLCTLLVVFAMNLFGAFEVTFQPGGLAGAPSVGPASSLRSFFEGALAVVLATPCTAPFLGTAVGFAFASTSGVIFAIFLSVGLGLAAPYLLVTLFPGFSGLVPRPGAWMLTVRKGLGFSLIATVVWLLWVAGRSVGVDAQALLLAYLVGVAFLVWVYGNVQSSQAVWLSRSCAVLAAVAIAFSLGSLPLEPVARTAPNVNAADAVASDLADEAWRPYDVAAIERARARGRPVFVDFTADWCITCKVNESVVLDSEPVRSEFARLNVATFKADWTLFDEEIRRTLAAHGRAGVPMYLVYPSGVGGAPRVLPELLTVDLTIEALRDAAAGEGA